MRDKQGAAAIGLYSFFAEHIDPTCGAVVCDQQFLANQMGVSTRTIRRWLDYLEEKGALVRIPVAGKVCAYALDPHEVWKGYNTSKDYSAFVTKTLVNKDGEIKRRIMAMFFTFVMCGILRTKKLARNVIQETLPTRRSS